MPITVNLGWICSAQTDNRFTIVLPALSTVLPPTANNLMCTIPPSRLVEPDEPMEQDLRLHCRHVLSYCTSCPLIALEPAAEGP